MVHPVTTEIVSAAIALAKRDAASVIVLRLNTPGGLMDAMRDTIQRSSGLADSRDNLCRAQRRPFSLGWLLHAGSRRHRGHGAGHEHRGRAPVAMGGEMDAVMKEKVENDAAAYMRSICTKRGRNAALAETAVRESKSFTEPEALDQHLIDLIAPNDRALLEPLTAAP